MAGVVDVDDEEKPSSSGTPAQAAPEVPECCICVETALHPVKLPCSHVFCYLCIKGCYLQQGGLCPLCRAPIPPKYMEKPKLVGVPEKKKTKKRKGSSGTPGSAASKKKRGGHPVCVGVSPPRSGTPPTPLTPDDPVSPPRKTWYYEGRNGGWWQYDERTAALIDEAAQKGDSSLEVLLAGNMYVLDLVGKEQIAKHNPSLKRKMKHDDSHVTSKGVAGLTALAHP